VKTGAKISISTLTTPPLFPPFLYHSYALFPHTPAVALLATGQGRQAAGFTSREKKQWKGSPYEWRYQYSIALVQGKRKRFWNMATLTLTPPFSNVITT
jgi:hypothetical protein